MSLIPYGRQDIDDADVAAVLDVLRSDWLTQGPAIARFERAMADYCGAKYAVAVSNGTAALHLACLALNLGPQQRLWTSPITFVASANCARYCGAEVDFVDIEPRTYNMNVEALTRKLEDAARSDNLPTVLVPVHFAGQACDMQAISLLAKKYDIRVIEDASHAVGASYRGQPVGSGNHADISVFSFHPVKIMTTGEGGMLLTNNAELYEKLMCLRTHGITREPSRMVADVPEGGWYYEQIDLGFNYRLTDLQAALGTSQLRRLDRFVARRRQLAARYDRMLADLPVTPQWQHPDTNSSYHLYALRLNLERIGKNRQQVYNAMRNADIGVQVHYIPVHRQPYYRSLGFRDGDFPLAERYYSEALTLPLYYTLTESEQDRVVEALRQALT